MEGKAFSSQVMKLQSAATLEMARLARERQQEGKPVYSLALGEPDFDTPKHIQEAAQKAMEEGYTHYPPLNGFLELREAAAQFLNRFRSITYSADQIFVTSGAKQAIVNALLSILNPGDKVLLCAPYWVSYKSMVEYAQAIPIIHQTKPENGFKITPSELESFLEQGIKCVIFNSPCNPTGSIYKKDEIISLLEVLKRYPQVWIISDEIYDLFDYHNCFTSFAIDESIADRLILIHGVSKLFAMTGWRIGILATHNSRLLNLIARLQGLFTSGACSISQRAAIAAYSGPLEPVYQMRNQFASRITFACGLLTNYLPFLSFVKPQGAFYIYLDVSPALGRKSHGGRELRSPDELVFALLEENGVATVSGIAFGTEHHIRLSCATDEETIANALEQMKNFFQNLK